ncbi:hypothetical protein [Serratia symbiotica]|uniref:hypothetical protein n=1 Tax=Serratia symbiotica TaxID=138074 RepID=UPI0030D54068
MSFLSAAFVMPLLLTGCVQNATSNDLSQQQQEAIPRIKVVDYRLAALRYPVAVERRRGAG